MCLLCVNMKLKPRKKKNGRIHFGRNFRTIFWRTTVAVAFASENG